MTDKEQIIVDGMDVGGCKYLNTFSDCDGYYYYCDLGDDIKNEYCEYYKDCYFKQLASKTQECEELKEENQELRNSLSGSLMFRFTSQDKEVARYRKALEEIEKVINNILNSCLGRNTVGCRPAHNVCGDLIKILNIINKTKDGNNE